MKLFFKIQTSRPDSNGVKEYGVLVTGQFPITKYSNAVILEDILLKLVNQKIKGRKPKLKQKTVVRNEL